MTFSPSAWRPQGTRIYDARFDGAGWEVWQADRGRVVVAIRPRHVTHSVHVLPDEPPASAVDRLWGHLNETYPGGTRAG